MSDLDLKFSGAEPLENNAKNKTNSLDLKLNNGQFEEVKAQKTVPVEVEKPKPYKEEYFENLLEEKVEDAVIEEQTQEIFEEASDKNDVTSQLADEIFEEIVEEAEVQETEEADEEVIEEIKEELIVEETDTEEKSKADEVEVSEEDAKEPEQSAVSQLADEIFEEIVEQAEIEETEVEESIEEETVSLEDEKEIITNANSPAIKSSTDEILDELAKDTHKGKYDFINLCVLAIMVLFLGLTFVFMKQTLTNDDSVKITAETLKTGDFTNYLGEEYVKRLPLEKVMTQANVLMRKLFGKTDLEFVVFKDSEPPDGPIDNNDIGGISAGESMMPDFTVTTVVTTPQATTTTPKIIQDFEVTTPKEVVSESGIFTGRPIKTTTTKVTTTLDLPKTTDETTTGKVNLIFPE